MYNNATMIMPTKKKISNLGPNALSQEEYSRLQTKHSLKVGTIDIDFYSFNVENVSNDL